MTSSSEKCVGYFSKGIAKLPCLSTYLNAQSCRIGWKNSKQVTHVCGWGMKPTSRKARAFADQHKLPYISLEDGFIRSLGLGVNGTLPLSLVVDYSGIYYDARSPSDLETLIVQADFSEADLKQASEGMNLIRQYRLSKYNHAPDVVPKDIHRNLRKCNYRVLVVDQTSGDASIELGMADENSFFEMLIAAITEHPDAQILVKIHPDVIAGKKQGHLLQLARKMGCTLISTDISPWALLDLVDEVYVVTSQLGIEALMAGKKVHTFGMPFYAGWGLTNDRLVCHRRGVRRTLHQLFTAAYVRYCRYVNPYTGLSTSLTATLDLLADQKHITHKYSGHWVGLDFSGWKKSFLPGFFGSNSHLTFLKSRDLDSKKELNSSDRLFAWASKTSHDFELDCHKKGLNLWRMEDGFIRSVGLGVNLIPPMSLVLDSKGIYFDSSRQSDLEELLNKTDFDKHLLDRAARLRQLLVEHKLSKYNVGKPLNAQLNLPEDRPIILVPGQVESDASIRLGSPIYKTNLELLQAVRKHNPDSFVIYKPHPDVLSGGRVGGLLNDQGVSKLIDLQVEDIPMPELLQQVDEVHTICSLTGFEALLRDLKVVTYGVPFYAGWGLTEDMLVCSRRIRPLNLDELVAATLILYPVYFDHRSGNLINAETAVHLLLKPQPASFWQKLRSRVYCFLRKAY